VKTEDRIVSRTRNHRWLSTSRE